MRVIRLYNSMDGSVAGGCQDGEQYLLNVQVAAKIADGLLKKTVGKFLFEQIGLRFVGHETEMLQHCFDFPPEGDTLLSEMFDTPVIAQLVTILI